MFTLCVNDRKLAFILNGGTVMRQALSLDREMRASVRTTGKRPREAFGETMASLTKRFKTAEDTPTS